MFYIYYLERNDIPFYVGKAQNIVIRKHTHRNKLGKDLDLIVIDEVEDWKYWETFYIYLFKSWGFKLENKNNGGGGPSQYSEEQKEKMRKPRPGSGAKISKTLKEGNHSKYYTKEIRNKISKGNLGKSKIFSIEHLEHLALANLESKGKIVECYDLENNFIKSFSCLREAKIWVREQNPLISINVDKQIKDCCNGRQKTCHKFKWKYKI